jgi:hypothetical protein
MKLARPIPHDMETETPFASVALRAKVETVVGDR